MVGKYNVTVTILEERNYTGATDTVDFEIRKIQSTISIINENLLNKIYDGNATEVEVEASRAGDINKEYKDSEGNILPNAPKDVGTYTVKVTLAETETHTGAEDEVTYTINKATKDMSKVTFNSAKYDYDGTEKEIVISGELPEGVEVTYAGNKQTEPGKHTALAKFTVIPEEEAKNYHEIESMAAILEIIPVSGTIEIKNADALNKVYDGNPIVDVDYVQSREGKVRIEYYKGTETVGEILTDKPVNAGKYTVKLVLEAYKGYTETYTTATFEITKAPSTITILNKESLEKTYDGNKVLDPEYETSREGQVRFEYYAGKSATGKPLDEAQTNSGTYTIKAILEDTENYAEATDVATFEIRKILSTIEITNKEALNRVYNKEALEVTYAASREGTITTEYYKGTKAEGQKLKEVPVNVGFYTVKVILAEELNHTGAEAQTTFEIAKATKDMSNVRFDSVSLPFDEREKEILISGELPEGVEVSYENNRATDVGIYEAKAHFEVVPEEEAGNYNDIPTLTATLEIYSVPGEVEITNKEDLNKVYDGNPIVEPIITRTRPGDIIVEYYEGEDTTGNRLFEKPVNAGKYTIKAILKKFRGYSEATTTATFEISKADSEITILNKENLGKIYDGIAVTNPDCETSIEGNVIFNYYIGNKAEGELLQSAPVNSGIYTVEAILEESQNYKSSSDTATFEIEKINSTIEITNAKDLSRVYDKNAISVTYNSSREGTIKVEYTNTANNETSPNAPKDAGNYRVKVTLEEEENYKGAEAQATFVIEKATKDISKITFVGATFDYDRTEKAIFISGELPEGVEVSYENNKATEPGIYEAKAHFVVVPEEEAKNYKEIPSLTASFEIKAVTGTIKITNKEAFDKVYDGNSIVDPEYETSREGNVRIEYYAGTEAEGEMLTEKPVNAGKYVVKVVLESYEGYLETFDIAQFEITKATSTITILDKDILGKEYDKNPVSNPKYETSREGNVKFEYYVGEEAKGQVLQSAPVNAGIYTVKAILEESQNYLEAFDTATFTITKTTYDMSNVKFEDATHTYDGTEKSIVISGTLPEGVEVSYENNIGIDAGIYDATAIFTNPDPNNYEDIENKTAILTILQAEGNITITNADSLNKVYDGKSVIEPTYDKLGDGTVRFEYYNGTETEGESLAEAPVNVGIYTVKVIAEECKNYKAAYATATFEITKATHDMSEITFEDKEYQYDGTEKSIVINGILPEGVEVSYENNTHIDVGEYIATAKFIVLDTHNYNEISDMTAKLTITKIPGNITIIEKDKLGKIYDGTPVQEPICDRTGDGTVRFEYYAGTEATGEIISAPIIVGTYTVKAILEETKNYTEAFDTATFEITKATYDMSEVKFENKTYTYDGTEKSVVITGNLPIGVEVSYENNTGIVVGEYKAIAKFTILDTHNYNEIPDMEAILTIEKATYDMSNVKFEDATYIYDGFEKVIEITGELPAGVEVTYENNKGTTVGKYEAIAKFTIPDPDNYNQIPDMTATLSIRKLSGSIKITNKDNLGKIYDGKIIEEPTYIKVGDGNVRIEYYSGPEAIEKPLDRIPINAGVYTAKVILEASENHEEAFDTATFEILKATYDMTDITFEDASYEYDGTEKQVIVKGNVPKGVVVVYENNAHTDVGEYEAIAKFNVDERNYNTIEDKKAKLTIVQSTGYITITNKSEFSKVYDGKPVAEPKYEIIGDGEVKVEYFEGNIAEGEALETIPKDIGIYTIRATLEETVNYKGAIDETTFEITKASYDMSEIKFEDIVYTYDGTEKEILINGELPDGVTVVYENNKGTNVGEYEATARFVLEDAHNYNEVPMMFAKMIIEKATYDMTNIKFEDAKYTYDKNEKQILISGDLPTGVTVVYENNAATNAGEYEAIARFVLEDTHNYNEISEMRAKLTIEKAVYDMSQVSFEDTAFEYDGTEKQIVIEGQVPEGVIVNYENNIGTELGEYLAIAKFVGDSENYYPIEDMYAMLIIYEKIDFGEYNIQEFNNVNYIEYIEEELTIREFKEKVSPKSLEIYKNGNLVENDEELVTTGTEIRIRTHEGIYVYVAVVKGDVTRDGKVNDADLLMLARYMVGAQREVEFVNEASLIASDVYEDNRYATDADLLALAKMLLK